MQTTTPFLMFKGNAKQAIKRYQKCFLNTQIEHLDYYESKHKNLAGQVKYAELNINGQKLILIDSPVEHAFGFTPAQSFMVEFDDSKNLTKAYHELVKDGEILMPLDSHDFAEKYAWINDSYGVSWQLKYNPR